MGECALSKEDAVAISTSLCVEAWGWENADMLASGSCPDCWLACGCICDRLGMELP